MKTKKKLNKKKLNRKSTKEKEPTKKHKNRFLSYMKKHRLDDGLLKELLYKKKYRAATAQASELYTKLQKQHVACATLIHELFNTEDGED